MRRWLRLKEGFGPPDRYLGTNVEKVQLKDGRFVWSTNCVDYLKSAIEMFDNSLGVDKTALKNDGDGYMPYSSRFRLELCHQKPGRGTDQQVSVTH